MELIVTLRPDIWVKELSDRGREIVKKEARLVEQLGEYVVWANHSGYRTSITAIESQ